MRSKHLFFVLLAVLFTTPFYALASKQASTSSYTDITAEHAKAMTSATASLVIPDFQNVTVMEAKTMIDTNPSLVILDVRNQSEYVTGHIRNTLLIPLYELDTSLDQLNPADTILVYCKAGSRSASASQILVSNGFTHIYNMLGGITDWTRQEYPTYINYASIQEAIDNATDGDTLYIGQGFYSEHLSVNKSLAIVGENRDTTTVDGSGNGTVLYVNADNFSISGFKIQYSGCACKGYCGINIESHHQNINIADNTFVSDGFGIQIDKAQNVIITNNNITHNTDACIFVHDSTRLSVIENNITDNLDGIDITNTSQTIFLNNNITNSVNAIALTDSDNNTIIGNIISSNAIYGLYIMRSNDNVVYHNTFKANGYQVAIHNSTNIWDNGVEGNYWSNYTGTDTDNDGIGNTPHPIDSQNLDHYPLIGMFCSYHTPVNQDVNLMSNSTIDSFEYVPPNSIKLQVSSTSTNQTTGFCRIGIPHALIDPANGTIQVIIDNGQAQTISINNTLYDNGTYRWIYFTYQHSTHQILIVPEFSPLLILPLFITTTAFVTLAQKKRRTRMH
jgi:parallel beta-helix repeat protein